MEAYIQDEDIRNLVQAAREIRRALLRRGLDEATVRALVDKPAGKASLAPDGSLEIGGARVNLTPLERALYGLLFRHPEGIRPADFWRHYTELLEIYRHMTVFFDHGRTEAAVDTLCDDDRRTLRTNVSRIRRKVRETAGETAAGCYAIALGKDGAYRIPARAEMAG